MTAPVLATAAGFWWFNFSVGLFWLGIMLLVVTSVRAYFLTQRESAAIGWRGTRPWLRRQQRRATGRRQTYQ